MYCEYNFKVRSHINIGPGITFQDADVTFTLMPDKDGRCTFLKVEKKVFSSTAAHLSNLTTVREWRAFIFLGTTLPRQ